MSQQRPKSKLLPPAKNPYNRESSQAKKSNSLQMRRLTIVKYRDNYGTNMRMLIQEISLKSTLQKEQINLINTSNMQLKFKIVGLVLVKYHLYQQDIKRNVKKVPEKPPLPTLKPQTPSNLPKLPQKAESCHRVVGEDESSRIIKIIKPTKS